MGNQSQSHGFIFENELRTKVFNLPSVINDKNIHDIELDDEYISIKTTKSSTINMGCIRRLSNYTFDRKHTLVVIHYKQENNEKIVENIYEFDFNEECHKMLFGGLNKEDIEGYNKLIKSMEKKKCEKQSAIYCREKQILQEKSNCELVINPKVDHSGKRVQASIPKFKTILKDYLKYESTTVTNKPNCIRGVSIVDKIASTPRKRFTDNTHIVTQEHIDSDTKYVIQKLKDLKLLCSNRNLKMGGKKLELRKRLIADDLQTAAAAATETATETAIEKLSEEFVKL